MHEVSESLVLDALSKIRDPDLGKDIVNLKMIKDIQICGDSVEKAASLFGRAHFLHTAIYFFRSRGASNSKVSQSQSKKQLSQSETGFAVGNRFRSCNCQLRIFAVGCESSKSGPSG